MAYLQDFYHLDIDDSYIEYVISELKYDDNDILLLHVNKTAESSQCFRCESQLMPKWRKYWNHAAMKVFQN